MAQQAKPLPRLILARYAYSVGLAAGIEIVEEYRPLMLVRFFGTASDPVFKNYLRRMEAWLDDPTPYAVILDAREAGSAPRHHQKWQGEWMKTHREALTKVALGTAFVISSPTIRFVLSAIFLVQRPPMDYIVVGSMSDAVDWSGRKLARAGLRLPVGADELQ